MASARGQAPRLGAAAAKALPKISLRLIMPIWAPGMPGMSMVGSCMPPDRRPRSRPRARPARRCAACGGTWSGSRRGVLADQRVEQALLGGQLGLGLDLLAQALAGHGDGDLDQVADDLLDVAADVADLGELGRLDLEEGRLRQARQAAGDLGLADAGRPDHQDVLGQDLLAQLLGQLLAPPAVAQGDGDGALGVVLADDEAVQLGDDLARREGAGLAAVAAPPALRGR